MREVGIVKHSEVYYGNDNSKSRGAPSIFMSDERSDIFMIIVQ